jgi:hypothetical protein
MVWHIESTMLSRGQTARGWKRPTKTIAESPVSL